MVHRRDRCGAPLGAIAIGFGLVGAPAAAQPRPVVGPQVRIDVGGGTEAANETTVSASEANPLHVVAGWNDWRRSTSSELINAGFALSLDGGDTWNDFLVRPPAANQSSVEGDPMTAFDPRTGTLWAGAISFSAGAQSGLYVARKDPQDSSFRPAVMARQGMGTDKCWMAAGALPGQPDTTRLYITYNQGVIWSDDLGTTWTSPRFLDSGLGFLPRIGPNGELYVAYWDGGVGMLIQRSLDGGQTFTTRTVATRMDVWGTQDGSRFPGNFRVPSLLYLDVDDATGVLYACYFDTTDIVGGQRNVDLYLTTSSDRGDTWTTPVVINQDASPPGDQFFPWIESDVDGNLHLVFLDSRNTVQNDGNVDGMLDAYYMYSVNGGATWSEHRLTPQSWSSNDDGLNRSQQFIGDYLGLTVAGRRAFPVYVDTSAGDTDTFTNVVLVPLPGDVNGDGVVDMEDLLGVLAAWGACGDPDGCDADLDGSGAIDFADLLIVLANWGSTG